MSGGKAAREVEVKLAAPSPREARARLEKAGFVEVQERTFEANSVFDTSDQRLQGQRQLLRLREFGGVATVTWKGPPASGPHKSREEIETVVGDAKAIGRIWQRLGYRVVFRYEKYRTTLQEAEGGEGMAVLDETPIGCFVELEGPAEWIDKKAQEMGYGVDEYITDSYASLYVIECVRRGIAVGNMVFSEEGKR
ncbi:MAG TPA: adenylate cyclase [Solibacterales bacterium]|nr:adenylate cyclase [Bryobacterales bacterium]